jgi:hypothetical protein
MVVREMTLFVVYVPDTGHVVGAVNSIGAVPPADVAALVGTHFPLRVALEAGEIATLDLPVRELAFHTPDDEPDVFVDPLAFGVELPPGPGLPPKPALVDLTRATTPLTFGTDWLDVEIQTAAAVDLPVLALVSDGQDTRLLPGTIKEGEKKVTLTMTVDKGPHGVLVLVAGWVGRLEKVEKS